MPPRTFISISSRTRICESYHDKISMGKIAVAENLTEGLVKKVLLKAGVVIRTGRWDYDPSVLRDSKHLTEEIVEAYIAGESGCTISTRFRIPIHAVYILLKKAGQQRRPHSVANRIHHFNEGFFEPPLSNEAMYYAGLLATDGCVSIGRNGQHAVCIRLIESDGDIIRMLARTIGCPEAVKLIPAREGTNAHPQIELSLTSSRLVDSLIALGITPRKSFSLCVSAELENNSHFWRGAFDGDGCVRWGKGKYPMPSVGLVSCSWRFASQCMDFCRTFVKKTNRNVHAGSQYRQGKRTAFSLGFTCRMAYCLLSVLYPPNITPVIARKAKIAWEIQEYYKRKDSK